jgi:tRNA (Thr-GGU) A37 N-methylase
VEREANVLTVRGLDALNGSPVLDVKPYLPRGDSVAEARTPEWLRKLFENRK